MTDSSNFILTDSSGNYKIEEVIAGTYTISFSHADYFDTTVSNISLDISEGYKYIIDALGII